MAALCGLCLLVRSSLQGTITERRSKIFCCQFSSDVTATKAHIKDAILQNLLKLKEAKCSWLISIRLWIWTQEFGTSSPCFSPLFLAAAFQEGTKVFIHLIQIGRSAESTSKFHPAFVHQEFLVTSPSLSAAHGGHRSLGTVPPKLALHKTHVLLREHNDLHVDMMTWLAHGVEMRLESVLETFLLHHLHTQLALVLANCQEGRKMLRSINFMPAVASLGAPPAVLRCHLQNTRLFTVVRVHHQKTLEVGLTARVVGKDLKIHQSLGRYRVQTR